MIPEQLHLRNFLSHRETDLDLRGIHVASLIGDNGAGKSAILDSITWAVWGRARTPHGHDDELVHHGETAIEVEFTFRMSFQGGDEQRFRILRRREQQSRRATSSILDFQVETETGWRPLNGNSVRETQARIVDHLGLDYDTFINSAYLRQGHADEFTVQSPGDRKRVLGVILGLDQWERYAERARQARVVVQTQEEELARRLSEIKKELSRRPEYQASLLQAEANAQEAVFLMQKAQELLEALTRIQEKTAALQRQIEETQRRLVEERSRLGDLQSQANQHQKRCDTFRTLLERADSIETALRQFKTALDEERVWNEKLGQAARLQEEKTRAEQTITREAEMLREQIRRLEREAAQKERALVAARGRIEQDIQERRGRIRSWQERLPAKDFLAALEEKEGQLEFTAQVAQELEHARADLQNSHVTRTALTEHNRHLKASMDETKERLDALTLAKATCPLCGQILSPEHREQILQQYQSEGRTMADEYRSNLQKIQILQAQEVALNNQIKEHDQTLRTRSDLEREIARMHQKLEQAKEASQLIDAMEAEIASLNTQLTNGAYGEQERQALSSVQAAITELEAQLASEAFGTEARASLKAVLEELSELGYDAAAHNVIKARVQSLSSAENDYRELEKARVGVQGEEEALKHLAVEITVQEQRILELESTRISQKSELETLLPQLETLPQVQRSVQAERQKEAQARQLVGAARQQLAALDTLERRLTQYRDQHTALMARSACLKELREAFGVNGIPAMIIEHALPAFELEANRLLEQLSSGRMHVRFETQRENKSGNVRETLDIIISDEKGSRPYENYSGGEQFRINFAIRVALAHLLAQRAGMRPRTLFVDEGFGSLDAEGRQRLVEAVKAVQDDFDLILVITHIEELRDAFPVRIQVSKTEAGSFVELV